LLHPWLHPDAPPGRPETPSARIGFTTGSARLEAHDTL
jgi:hypothetical protein